MTKKNDTPAQPDLTQGIARAEFSDGHMVVGHVGGEQVLLVRRGDDFFAIGAHCTHYHAALAEGLLVGYEIRCPWHHACFDVRTGEALRAPALSPVACWSVEQDAVNVYVREKRPQPTPRASPAGDKPGRVVVVGGGAAGFAAAEMLRRQNYQGELIMLSHEESPPIDRPNLSKDYLAGTAQEDWIPLRPDNFYAENGIDLRRGTEVARIDARAREALFADGGTIRYDRLLIATGAEPVRLSIPGANQPHVRTLRSLADCRAIIERAQSASSAVVLGASFIGLEVAAALRARDIEVHVVAPESKPMERILGAQMGEFVRSLHEQHGVIFHLEELAVAIEGQQVKLRGGRMLQAELIVAGIGVRPRTQLAEQAGLAIDRGISVNAFLETSASGIFAAGDIARWPDPHSGESIRVEHWTVAERQGQTAALNMIGNQEKFVAVPFFWSQHYDVPINYVGHAERWDELVIEGSIADKDCLLRYIRGDHVMAVASIFRDLANLQAEVAMEKTSA